MLWNSAKPRVKFDSYFLTIIFSLIGIVSSTADVDLYLISECIVQHKILEYETVPTHCIIQISFVDDIWFVVRAGFVYKNPYSKHLNK